MAVNPTPHCHSPYGAPMGRPALKERYSIRVSRAGESIGEYRFNATPKGLEQLKERIKPELSYDILSAHGIIHTHVAGR